jgi:hypothetical protein
VGSGATQGVPAPAAVVRLAVVGDPQLADTHSYGHTGMRLAAEVYYGDRYMRRAFRALRRTGPHAVAFLGDLFDGGREFPPHRSLPTDPYSRTHTHTHRDKHTHTLHTTRLCVSMCASVCAHVRILQRLTYPPFGCGMGPAVRRGKQNGNALRMCLYGRLCTRSGCRRWRSCTLMVFPNVRRRVRLR